MISTIPTISKATQSTLIIGIGNTLRGDDGAGYQVAELVQDWALEGVRSLAVHQLTPDLAAEIAEVEQVIFVDAIAVDPQISVPSPEPTIERLEPKATATFTGHYAEPRSLLAITQVLYQAQPLSYQVLLPAIQFEFGEAFSTITQQSVKLALAKIHQLLVIE